MCEPDRPHRLAVRAVPASIRPEKGTSINLRAPAQPGLLLAALCLLLGLAPARAQGQQETEAQAEPSLRVFLDCDGRFCDFDFFRREIPFVSYTRDREDAQVHLLITSEQTGSGGYRFTLDFIGRERFAGLDDRLEVTTRANLASEQVLTQLTRIARLGILRYVARTPQASAIQVVYEAGAEEEAAPATAEEDPWNFWTFRVRGNANLDADDRTQFYRLSAGVSADRITEGLKLEFGLGGSYNESEFEINDTTSVTSLRRSYDLNALTVWSLSEHWSVGARGRASHSTFSNQDLAFLIAPALEYNIYPYSESTRRQFSILYAAGVQHFDYIQETIFFRMSETVPTHSLSAALSVRQPWGGSFGRLEFTQLLNDLSKHRFEAFAGIDLRLFRGLSLNLNGRASRVRDQINLAAGDATEEEILLRQRELQTGFEYGFSIGFSYTFGSIFSNVVNPRFERF